MGSSRVRFFEKTLSILGYNQALEALDWMKSEMCKEQGFQRHDGSDYYEHLVAVAQDLLNFGYRDEELIVAALLHDSVEDVEGITVKMIADRFTDEIARIVELLTKKKGINYKKGNHIVKYLAEIAKHPKAALIKAADRIHNFGTLRHATPEKKLRQALETKMVFIPFFKECRNAYPRYANYFFQAKTRIEPHLWEIEEHYEAIEKLKAELSKAQQQT